MVYVYQRYIKTGQDSFINVYDSWEDALKHIRKCYNIDKDLNQLGMYYYHAKERG